MGHINEKMKVIHKQDSLRITNSGPKGEGYIYCKECGLIEREFDNTDSRVLKIHQKPFPSREEFSRCRGADNDNVVRNLVLGCDFYSDICLFNFKLNNELFSLKPGDFNTKTALRTICEALVKASCEILDISPDELIAEYRTALNDSGQSGQEVEIFVYDTLPGGAGFAEKLTDNSIKYFERALEILKDCEAGCDSSCYYCLQSFKNKDQHALLDRFIGIELLEYLLNESISDLPEARKELAYNMIFYDLSRQDETLSIEQNIIVSLNGRNVNAPIHVKHNDKKYIIVFLDLFHQDCQSNKNTNDL